MPTFINTSLSLLKATKASKSSNRGNVYLALISFLVSAIKALVR